MRSAYSETAPKPRADPYPWPGALWCPQYSFRLRVQRSGRKCGAQAGSTLQPIGLVLDSVAGSRRRPSRSGTPAPPETRESPHLGSAVACCLKRAERVGLTSHPFEYVSRTEPTAGRFANLLASDVVFNSPVFVHPVKGRDSVAELLETVHTIFGVPTYRLGLTNGRDTVLLFDGEIDGRSLQAAVVIRDSPQGLIEELTVLMRPLPVVRRFGEEGMARLGLTEAEDIPSD